MRARKTQRWNDPNRHWRAGMTQLLFAVAGLAGGWAVAHAQFQPKADGTRVFEVLIAVGFGVLSIAAVIFSLLFLVVQWASSTLTPRLNLFRDDPIVWRTFAYIVGVFIFCLTAALTIGSRETVSAAIPIAATLLALIAIMLIRRLQVKAFASIQLAPMLAAVTERGANILQRIHSGAANGGVMPITGQPVRELTWPGHGCVLQQIHLRELANAASTGGAVVLMRQQIGASLLPGSPLAAIHGGSLAEETVRAALVTGLERDFGQDPLFGFRLLADIALRALSTAVNDPATAVQALDRIHELYLAVAGFPPADGHITDAQGTVRLVLALPSWEDYLCTGLDDIIAARGRSPQVLQRLEQLLQDLHQKATADQKAAVEARMHKLKAGPGVERPPG